MSFTKQEIANLIDSTAWASDFSWSQMLLLSDYLQVHHALANELICDEGDTGDSMSILIKGTVKIYKNNKALTELKPGRTFGEMSLFDNERRSARIIAIEPCTYLTMDQISFDTLSKEYPALALKVTIKVARLLSQNIRRTSGHLCEFLEY